MTTAPMADTKPIIKVTSITVGVIPSKPITSNCNSSNRAGNENTAMNTSGAMRLYRNILFVILNASLTDVFDRVVNAIEALNDFHLSTVSYLTAPFTEE